MKRTATIVLTAAMMAAAGSAYAGGGIEDLATVRVASGLNYPVGVTHAPGDYARIYIIEKPGRIKVLNTRTGSIGMFLDINATVGGGTSTNNEQGMLGLAFHPDFANNNYFYVNFTNNSGNTTVARFTANDSHDTAVASSISVLMTITQPLSNHNGGWMGFGPNDGYLYIATGDGGGAGDTGNRAQDITNQLLGKMLRIDVDGGSPYAIPASNPFVGITGDDEIWAYGLRNPWRCSFDRLTGDLYMADVGQNAWEEVNFQPADSAGGENYGWRCREGMHNFNFSGTCSSQTFTEPFIEYSHGEGLSITGGQVYRGCEIPSLADNPQYFFSDYIFGGRIWTVDAGGTDNTKTNRYSDLTPDVGTISAIASYGEDARGEVYIVDQSGSSTGEVFKIVAAVPTISIYDVNCNGAVDFKDLVTLLSTWGPCVGCPADFDGDDEVTFVDLVGLLNDWD